MSSGCAPKASRGAGSGRAVGVGLIRSIDLVTPDEEDLGRLFAAKIGLLARSGDVVRAPQDGLHPPKACVSGRADLLRGERGRAERHEGVAAGVQLQDPA